MIFNAAADSLIYPTNHPIFDDISTTHDILYTLYRVSKKPLWKFNRL
jgi:hypothetical protein